MTAIKTHDKFYEKYRANLYNALAGLFMSLSSHTFEFNFWCKKLSTVALEP